MLKKNIYVRCPMEPVSEEYPRYFCVGKINDINTSSEKVKVVFYDVDGIGEYYEKPVDMEFSFKQVKHAKIIEGSKVYYNNQIATIQAVDYIENDGYYYYYLLTQADQILYACETDIMAGYNNGSISPLEQLKTYEFQKPIWYVGRSTVSKTMQIIANSLYGFKELAGCKIFLKAYQLKTVMRCLQQKTCRYMIADEVGLGKTVEAIAVLKVFLKDKHNKRVLLVVPETLIEQWKTELAFKFELFEGANVNNNFIRIIATDEVHKINQNYDFIIVDEVHRFIKDTFIYDSLLNLSKRATNILMLSATPVQNRKEEYKKLLTLIQPEKYESLGQEEFNSMLSLQNSVVRKVHDALSSIDVLNDEIRDADGKHTEDTEDVFDDIYDSLTKIQSTIKNETFNSMLAEIDYEAEDFGVPMMRTAIAFVCENYQLEKSIIRNRRVNASENGTNERKLLDLSYDLQTEFNNAEYNVYRELCDWIGSIELDAENYSKKYGNIVCAFFSSANAFYAEIEKLGKGIVPKNIFQYAKTWQAEESKLEKTIKKVLDDPHTYSNRATRLLDFIDQECVDKKVLIFTHYKATFDFYKKLMLNCLGDKNCCFFCQGMSRDDLELNAYRFQSDDEKYHILLSDETGGEGRNFQNADYVIHIDIPWEVNTLEQRIGRLDRIGRDEGKPVISVVSYAKDTLEEDLFKLWAEGINIFTKAQSGLEIIMNDINEKIVDTLCDDFKYGLSNIIPEIVKLIKEQTEIVNRERYFDIAAFQYSIINQSLMRSIELLNKNETDYFASAMMSWANLSGFYGKSNSKARIIFTKNSLAYNAAKNALFVPPDMKGIIDDKLNQLRNRIRQLNGELLIQKDYESIQGTFIRELAILNDYLHFYAPGDKIFDSIINNAVRSYKGTCAAFEMPAEIDWTGLIFIWNVKINESLVYEKGINRYTINQYRGFLPSEQIITAIPLNETEFSEEEVIRQFKKIFSIHPKEADKFKNYGERHGGSAYVQKFQKAHPVEKWQAIADRAYQRAYKRAMKKINSKAEVQLSALKQELMNQTSAQKAAAIYYGSELEVNINEIEKQNEEIYNIIKSYEIVLDSVCFIRMKKHDAER